MAVKTYLAGQMAIQIFIAGLMGHQKIVRFHFGKQIGAYIPDLKSFIL